MRASRSIEARCEREKLYNKEQVQSTGVAYSELKNWRYMEDDNIRESIQKMILELKEDKYAYHAYSNIIELLLFFNKLGLYKGDVYEVQKIMLSLVEKDMHICLLSIQESFFLVMKMKNINTWRCINLLLKVEK